MTCVKVGIALVNTTNSDLLSIKLALLWGMSSVSNLPIL